MRVKNVLFTAITAGIIFLSGIAILGKGTPLKKKYIEKDYTDIPKVQIAENEQDAKTILLEEQRITITTQADDMKRQLAEEANLLQMMKQMMLGETDHQIKGKNKHAFQKVDGVLALDMRVDLKKPIHGRKALHNIREPSVLEVIDFAIKQRVEEGGVYEKG